MTIFSPQILAPRFKRPASAGTPATIFGANLLIWVDAQTSSITTESGGRVTQWNDLSGNSNHFVQVTGSGYRPTYNATGINSKPSITTDASVNQFMRTAVNSIAPGGSQLSAFVVTKYLTNSTTNGRFASFVGNGVGDADYPYTDSAVFLFNDANNCNSYRANAYTGLGTALSAGTVYHLGSIYDGANSTVYNNNVAGTPVSSTGNFGALGTSYFGGLDLVNGTWLNAEFGEIVWVKGAISSGQRASLESYFSGRW